MTIKKFFDQKVKETEKLGKETYPVFLYLMHILGFNETEIYLHFNDKMSEELIQKFDEGFAHYLYQNEPVQYLIGYHNFYGYKFIVDKRVLIPRFETEELAENVLLLYDEYFDGSEVSACDIGTGSGALAITLKLEEPHFKMVGTDISEEALEVAELNAKNLGADVKFLCGDMLEPLKGQKFDFIISNPPYIPEVEDVDPLVKDNEPNVALFGGIDGLKFYRIILSGAKDLLKERGIIAFEHGYNTKDAIEKMAHEYLENIKVIHKKDLQGKDRMTFILVGEFNG